MKSKIILIISIICCAPFFLKGQNTELDQKLVGMNQLDEIMKVVDEHYAEIRSGERQATDEMKYKHWARWAYYMSHRTAPGGKLVNVEERIQKELKRIDRGSRSNAGTWSNIGPHEISGAYGSSLGIGRVDRIAFHPTDANIMYIGTPNGGIWKTINGGTSWTPMSDQLPSLSVSGIVVSHTVPNVIYVLTGNGDNSWGGSFLTSAGYFKSSAGVFVSYDSGESWTKTGPIPINDPYTGYQLVQDPENSGTLLAATDHGIFRTTNFGGSWDTVLVGRTFEIKFKPGNSSYVFATQSGMFFRSTDHGATWTQITNFSHSLQAGRIALAVSHGDTNKVYLLSGASTTGLVYGGLFLSNDSGTTFTRMSQTPNIIRGACDGSGGSHSQSSYDLALGASHVSPNKIISGGIWSWYSGNGGLSWSNVSGDACNAHSSSAGFVHADVHDIEYHPITGEVFLCSDGGLVKSNNHGQDWINLSDGIEATQIYHMAGSTSDVNRMMIGTQDNGVIRRHANTNIWDFVLSGDGFDAVYNNNSSSTGYVSSNTATIRFTSHGASWSNVTPDPDSIRPFFPRVEVHNTLPGFVLAGYDTLWRSTDYGATWTNEEISGNWALARCPNNNDRFYAAGGSTAFAATQGDLWRSDNNGNHWQRISLSTNGFPSANLRITDIDVRPNNSDHVYVTFGGFGAGTKVYVSYNAGMNWSNLTGSLPNIPVNTIEVDQSGNMYIGTDIGVYYRGSAMANWVPFWNDLPIIPVSDLELYEGENKIRAATFGRGVWESDLYTSCQSTWVIFSNLYGHKYYETSNWISANKLIYGGENTDVVFKAGDHITLTQGFEVASKTRFRAYTAPCGVIEN